MKFLELRQPGYALLTGTGIEIGGFEHPAVLPHADKIIRCDRLDLQEARQLFREVDPVRLPVVDVQLDLDKEGLAHFPCGSLDFVVCCHVLEHLKNPIKALAEIFRALKPGGRAALAVPDKHFTFDAQRPLTNWKVLEDIFEQHINTPAPRDYLDVVKYNHPDKLSLPSPELEKYLELLMQRREHLNIWDSSLFAEFLRQTFLLLQISQKVVYEVGAEQSQFEYFAVIEKTGPRPALFRTLIRRLISPGRN
ncbi:MAG TPA: methyltransferase domain-containing protein [Opitutaceae bacterium]|nr:methyltransferase domain-containing protein [Opitutaceae bacterium]